MPSSIINNGSNKVDRHSSTKINRRGSLNVCRRGSMESKYVLQLPRQLPLRETTRNPLDTTSSRTSLIDGALAIMNSPEPQRRSSSQPRVMRRRGSLLSARQVNEMLLDSIDCLAEKVQNSGAFSVQNNNGDDYDSDLEDY